MKEKDNKSKYVNVIINIILVGIIISLLIDKNIIIGKEKQIIKEMTQSELESSLDSTITELNAAQEKYAADVSSYKTKITEAITSQGVTTEVSATADVVAANIGKIVSTKTVATATAAYILTGKTAWVNGTKITGTMANRGEVTATLNAGGSYTIPAGYHNGSGKVKANSLSSQTSATATASDIASGKTAWVNGSKVTGTYVSTSTNNIVKTKVATEAVFTVDISAYTSRYKELTADNFAIYPYKVYVAASSKTSSRKDIYYSLSYDASTGTLKRTGNRDISLDSGGVTIHADIYMYCPADWLDK